MVLLHGVASCAHEWDEVARPLAERFRVLALDLRGHGETTHSSRSEYGLEHLVSGRGRGRGGVGVELGLAHLVPSH